MIKSAAGLPPTKNSKHPHATKETKVGHISKMKDQNGTATYSLVMRSKLFPMFFLTRKNCFFQIYLAYIGIECRTKMVVINSQHYEIVLVLPHNLKYFVDFSFNVLFSWKNMQREKERPETQWWFTKHFQQRKSQNAL